MKNTLERLWNNYLSDECAKMNTEEERLLTKASAELHQKVSALLNQEQEAAMRSYVDTLCNLDAIFAKKAFFRGCEFAVSFLLEAMNLEKSS